MHLEKALKDEYDQSILLSNEVQKALKFSFTLHEMFPISYNSKA